MKVFILANEQQQSELQSINGPGKWVATFHTQLPQSSEYKNYEAFFILSPFSNLIDYGAFENKPVFINAVIETLSQLNLPQNVSRINAWPGFLKRETWEIASTIPEKVENVLNELNRKIIFVKDEPGFVAARVISMIINEAFFALGEKVSTKEEIDLAMKSGTNYPHGPFEWAEKIGVEKVYNLLEKLSQKEERYIPAPALKKLFLEKSEKNL